MIVHHIGLGLLWLVAIILMGFWPFVQFAQGMASTPSGSWRAGCIPSLIGLALAALLIWGPA